MSLLEEGTAGLEEKYLSHDDEIAELLNNVQFFEARVIIYHRIKCLKY
jgi:hypothetical protein